jgi:hypothetical protein
MVGMLDVLDGEAEARECKDEAREREGEIHGVWAFLVAESLTKGKVGLSG